MNQPLSPLEFDACWCGNTRKETATHFDHVNDVSYGRPSPSPPSNRGESVIICCVMPPQAPSERQTRTLTNLYNTRPTWLDSAHRRLDAAVCAAYGWPDELPDDEI